MDFRKIEWIFLIAFLGINIFLFSVYWNSQHEQSLVTNSNQREDITQRLQNDDIHYKGTISDQHLEGYYLSAEQVDLNEQLQQQTNPVVSNSYSITDRILTVIPIENREFDVKDRKQSFETLMKDPQFILSGDQYTYVPSISRNDDEGIKIVGAQSYERIPFIDETSRVTLDVDSSDDSDHSVTRYTQTMLKDIEPLREKMNLYSEKEILNTLYINNNIPSGATIQEIYLGYFRTLEVREKNVYVPVWFVRIESADKVVQVEKVNAISNQVISNNLVPKVENP
ncbi:two-component system regulatory protein YycI [Enterococcus sp. AZ109]|uniref:two-component system regulatory protein YycI n=1 Tax=Enterococcus sp. AZ109 TaxID=2774634 RepID=UPI003F24B1F4